MNILLSTYETPGLTGNFRRALQIATSLNSEPNTHAVILASSSQPRLFFYSQIIDQVTVIESPGIFPHKFRHSGYDPYDLVMRVFFAFFSSFNVLYSFNPKPVTVLPFYLNTLFSTKKMLFDWADLWGKGGIYDTKKNFNKLSGKIETFLEQWIVKKVSFTTCISHHMMYDLRKQGLNAIYLPIGYAQDLHPLPTEQARKMLHLPKNMPLVGFIYSDSPDVDYLKNILDEVAKADQNIKFIILGPKLLGSRANTNIIFNNFASREMCNLYLNACDVMLVPFSNKKINAYRFPNKIADYLAVEKPFIGNDFGEVGKYLKKYSIGWTGPVNSKLFAKKIITVVGDKKEILLKKKALKNNKQVLSWEAATKELKNKLNTLD
jgi:glycosyltransferase involved in cell wall biosynthesis